MKVVVGFDTSCYTTSVAAVTMDGELAVHQRKLITVGSGERGLQQSKGLFQHIQNLPQLVSEMLAQIEDGDIAAFCASSKPRPIEGSYMPVFLAGQNFGSMIAGFMKKPFFESTHQEGHVMAGYWSSKELHSNEFLAVHLSGGTTEILKVTHMNTDMKIRLMGGTEDLHAGQFVDRVGVSLGLPFPAGPSLELLAGEEPKDSITIPSHVKGLTCSFSGAESQAQRLISQEADPASIALETFLCIARTLEKLIINGVMETGIKQVLLVGGVASNKIIRNHVISRIQKHRKGIQLYFSDPEFSGDNAVGIALIGLHKYLSKGRDENG